MSDQLPKMLRVTWRRGERLQTSVGFLVAENAHHLVLTDTYDGKHPVRNRLWTVYHPDVVEREEVEAQSE